MQLLFYIFTNYSVATYTFTSGTLGTATITITYSYEDEEWGDLLVKYNGQTLTYDNIGNPLSWRDGMTMTWMDGRKLSTPPPAFLTEAELRPLTVADLYKPMGKIYNIPTMQMV